MVFSPEAKARCAEQAEREDRYLEVLQAQRVGAILITPARQGLSPLSRLISNGAAVALLDNETAGQNVCSVSVDDTLGGRLAAQHVIDLGHRSFAWLAGPTDIPQVHDREAGIHQAAREAEIPVTRMIASQMTVAAGVTAVDTELAGGQLPSALVCANDLLAFGAIRAILRAGLRVPQDVSIVGYDDIDFAANAVVPLTSVRQPKYELGDAAAQLLISEWADPAAHSHQQVRFEPQIVVRESTGPAPASTLH